MEEFEQHKIVTTCEIEDKTCPHSWYTWCFFPACGVCGWCGACDGGSLWSTSSRLIGCCSGALGWSFISFVDSLGSLWWALCSLGPHWLLTHKTTGLLTLGPAWWLTGGGLRTSLGSSLLLLLSLYSGILLCMFWIQERNFLRWLSWIPLRRTSSGVKPWGPRGGWRVGPRFPRRKEETLIKSTRACLKENFDLIAFQMDNNFLIMYI